MGYTQAPLLVFKDTPVLLATSGSQQIPTTEPAVPIQTCVVFRVLIGSRCSTGSCKIRFNLLLGCGCDQELKTRKSLLPQMDQRVEYVASFIRSNYSRKLSLTEMAETVHLSPWRLCHLFQEAMGTSPQRFLTKVRLEKARKLLATEFLTVKEVMNRVGMSDASSFARSFKAAYGLTPARYRSEAKAMDSHQERHRETRPTPS